QHQPIDRARAHRRQLRRRPAAERLAEQVGPAELRRVDEPQIEAGEVVHAFHPLGVAGGAEAGMGRGPDRVTLRHLVQPAAPATTAPGAVEHRQRGAVSPYPGVDVDAADRDRLLKGSHAPYYAHLLSSGPLDR